MKTYILNEAAFTAPVSISAKKANSIEFITTLQEADAPNRNGRVYPKKVLESGLAAPYVQERLRTVSFIGEANHPLDTSVQRQMSVDLRNAAFIIKEFWWEGNLLKARCETANTAVGRDMKGLIEQGVQVAFSLRAQGNVHTNPVTGLVEVESPLQICTYDWVLCPSHSKAFMEKICEATSFAMFGVKKDKLVPTLLCESENNFINGSLFNIDDEEVSEEEIDYTSDYTPKFKKVEDMYVPEEEDEVISIGEDTTLIKNKNNNVIKKVCTEDFLVKDFRKRLLSLNEGKEQKVVNNKLKRNYREYLKSLKQKQKQDLKDTETQYKELGKSVSRKSEEE